MLQTISKRLMTALTAIVLMMGILLSATPAFAAGTDGSIEITGGNGFKGFSVYQMFSQGENDNDGAPKYVLTEAWRDFFTASTGDGGIGLTNNADLSNAAYGYVKALGADNDPSVSEFARKASKWAIAKGMFATGSADAGTGTPTATVKGLSYGYYLVVPYGGTDSMLVSVSEDASNVAATLKSVYPTVVKTVNGNNHASASIGDTLEFTLTSTVPDISEYTSGYQFAFYDTLCQGLTVDTGSVVVRIGDQVVTDSCHITYSPDVGAVLIINFGTTDLSANQYDATELFTGKTGESITVTYTATLNSKAAVSDVGARDNSNSARIFYSNGTGIDDVGWSIESTTNQYTFAFDLKKTNGLDPLQDATFQLEDDKSIPINLVSLGNNTYRPAMESETASAVASVTTPEDGVVHFSGLGEGSYTLVEAKAPEGYNKASDTTVTISASYNNESGMLESWSINGNGQNPVEIVNNAGIVLPGTGGMGTVVFTVIGVVAILGGVTWQMVRRAKQGR